jgi:hypothetical protein
VDIVVGFVVVVDFDNYLNLNLNLKILFEAIVLDYSSYSLIDFDYIN